MRTSVNWVCRVAAAVLVVVAAGCKVTTSQLVWSDEFNGNSIDPANWHYDIGTGAEKGLTGWGNNELQYYTSRSENVRIEDFGDGNRGLVIEARREGYEGSSYTSARLLTQGLQSWTYGRIEARIKLPKGQGLWPAFWMLGNSIDTEGWPRCGELDIMEYRGQNTREVLGTIHYQNSLGAHTYSGNNYEKHAGSDFSEGFNVFSVEWREGVISWYVNDTPIHLENRWSSFDGQPAPFDKPFFILLNLAVGGNFVGAPNSSTSFPQRMYVDWVRVYE